MDISAVHGPTPLMDVRASIAYASSMPRNEVSSMEPSRNPAAIPRIYSVFLDVIPMPRMVDGSAASTSDASGVSPNIRRNDAQAVSYLGMDICCPMMLRTRDVNRFGSMGSSGRPVLDMTAPRAGSLSAR